MTTPNQPGYEADFMEEGGKSFSFDGQPPMTVSGIVAVDNPVRMQQRDFDTGDLLTWPDGNPKWQYRVDLQTELREAPDDDGMRSIYLKFRSKKVVVAAVKQAGATRLERGGRLALTYTSDDHSQPHRRVQDCTPQCQPGKGYPPKNYAAQYAPPAADWMADPAHPDPDPWATTNAPPAGGQGGWGAPAPQGSGAANPQWQQPPPQQAWGAPNAPATPTSAAAAPSTLPPDLRAFLVQCGLPEARVDAMTEAQARQIAATFQ